MSFIEAAQTFANVGLISTLITGIVYILVYVEFVLHTGGFEKAFKSGHKSENTYAWIMLAGILIVLTATCSFLILSLFLGSIHAANT